MSIKLYGMPRLGLPLLGGSIKKQPATRSSYTSGPERRYPGRG